jgi:hypothetical protein
MGNGGGVMATVGGGTVSGVLDMSDSVERLGKGMADIERRWVMDRLYW